MHVILMCLQTQVLSVVPLINTLPFQKQLEMFLPRRRPRMVRTRKPLIVQRRLVPKAEIPTRQIMALTMVPNSTHQVQTGSFLPVQLVQVSNSTQRAQTGYFSPRVAHPGE